MRRFKYYLIVTAVFFLTILFDTTAMAEEYKIGVVNAVRVLELSPQARKTTALIENEFSPRQKQLLDEQNALQTQEEKLTKDAAIMSETERRNLERDIINKRREYQRNENEFREDLTFRRNEELAKIQTEIVNAIQMVARNNNYDLVVSDGVIYASNIMDMTDLVLEYLSAQSSN